MQVLRANSQKATEALARKIAETLHQEKVLWLLCGGSNIPYAVDAMRHIRASVSAAELANLTIGQTDERYGPPGHADSNWKQLLDAGFDATGIIVYPMITGEPLAVTVADYAEKVDELFKAARVVIAQFGIGQDGHIAGVLPHSGAVADRSLVAAYEAPPFTRMTLTLSACKRISIAYAFVFGAAKQDVIAKLQTDVPLSEMPSQILKHVPEAYLYTDR